MAAVAWAVVENYVLEASYDDSDHLTVHFAKDSLQEPILLGSEVFDLDLVKEEVVVVVVVLQHFELFVETQTIEAEEIVMEVGVNLKLEEVDCSSKLD